jgi:hypothetical protein
MPMRSPTLILLACLAGCERVWSAGPRLSVPVFGGRAEVAAGEAA